MGTTTTKAQTAIRHSKDALEGSFLASAEPLAEAQVPSLGHRLPPNRRDPTNREAAEAAMPDITKQAGWSMNVARVGSVQVA